MVCDKGFGIGAARNRVEHRGFDFNETVLFHVVTNGRNDLKACGKAGATFFIDNEIHVPHTAALLGVAKTLVLIG